MNDCGFQVRVYRYHADDVSYTCAGVFVSRVYAIDKERDRFLVYDPGEGSPDDDIDFYIPEGFVWVDFLETMPAMSYEGREAVVKLF